MQATDYAPPQSSAHVDLNRCISTFCYGWWGLLYVVWEWLLRRMLGVSGEVVDGYVIAGNRLVILLVRVHMTLGVVDRIELGVR
jgi:hypothetical protein